MTFEQFKSAVESARPDVCVYPHGSFNMGQNMLGVVFIGKDGKQSKVYNYSGSYSAVLTRLNIEHTTKKEIHETELMLKEYQNRQAEGHISVFTKKPVDYTKDIARYTEMLEKLLALPCVD